MFNCTSISTFINKLMKGKAFRKHSLHEKTAASVILKPLIPRLFVHMSNVSGNTTMCPFILYATNCFLSFFRCKNAQPDEVQLLFYIITYSFWRFRCGSSPRHKYSICFYNYLSTWYQCYITNVCLNADASSRFSVSNRFSLVNKTIIHRTWYH